MIDSPALIVGHCCHDTLYFADGTSSAALGGSASYISRVFSAIGIQHQVVSKVGSDFQYFSEVKDHPKIVSSHLTTHFIADFTQGERISKLGALCEPIFANDLPQDQSFQIALAVGIMGEVLPETLDQMATQSRIVLSDIQGLIRTCDPEGRVGLRSLRGTEFYSRLSKITYLKVSQQEAQWIDLDEVKQKTSVLLTQGSKGCTLYQGDFQMKVPAFSVQEKDPTGAGDCFLAGFAAGLYFGFSLEKAVLTGNYFGSLAVQQVGVPVLPKFQGAQDLERAMEKLLICL